MLLWLLYESIRLDFEKVKRSFNGAHTQFFLKQSWEQKKLSLTPSFKHVGHCKEPASFSQSAPKHFFFVGGSDVMVGGRAGGRFAR